MSWMLPPADLDILAAAIILVWPRERTKEGEAMGRALLNLRMPEGEQVHFAAHVDWRNSAGEIGAVSYWVERVGVRVQVEREWAPATGEERLRCSLRSGPPTDSQRSWAAGLNSSAQVKRRAKIQRGP